MPTETTETELAIMPGYFDSAINDIGSVLEDARFALADVDFDTVVATGLSGAVVAPMLAHELGINFLILRKPDDLSTHAYQRAVGKLGKRWLFVDDFIDTGRTRTRVLGQVKDLIANNPLWTWDEANGNYHESVWEAEYVGTYEYNRQNFIAANGSDGV